MIRPLILALTAGMLLLPRPVLPAATAADTSPQRLTDKALTISISETELTDGRRWRELWSLLEEASENGAGMVVLKIHVPQAPTSDALPKAEQLARLPMKTVAFIDSAAVGGGALIALACDEIWMVPGSRIGAAAPDPVEGEKLSEAALATEQARAMAVVKAAARSLCKLKDHPADLVAAMIDPSLEIRSSEDVLASKKELLLLDEEQAAMPYGDEPPLADGVVADIGALEQKYKLPKPLVTLNAALLESEQPEVARKPGGEKSQNIQGPFTGKVVRITVGEDDLISPARFEFMARTLERCTDEGAEAVIFDLDTPGGLAWDTTNLMMRDLQKLGPPSYAFINPRALSAGAMIAIATDAIYIAPAGSVGAATPIYGNGAEMGEAERAKMNSAIMGMARTVAKQKGHDWRVIEAMIDKDRELVVNGETLCAEGEILTLDAEQAVLDVDGRPLFAKAIVKTLDDVKKAEKLKGETVTAEPTSFEGFAIWVTKYASILILIGMVAGYLEVQAPGFGLPGIIAVLAFGIFFFGHYVAGSLVGHETAFMVGLFILGGILLLTEVFLLPGTIVPGLLGFVCILVALVYTMSGWEIPEGVVPGTVEDAQEKVEPVFRLATYATGLRNVAIAIVGAAAVISILIRFLPETAPFRRMVLAAAAGGTPEETPALAATHGIQTGDSGVSRSALRPYGTIEINGKLVEAMVEGGYIQSGSKVRIREVSGSRIVVEPVA